MTIDRIGAGCPVCPGELAVWSGPRGYFIGCDSGDCPRPDAAADILRAGGIEREHVVTLVPSGFTVMHPLRERLGDALIECGLHAHLARRRPAAIPGRYQVTWRGDPERAVWAPLP